MSLRQKEGGLDEHLNGIKVIDNKKFLNLISPNKKSISGNYYNLKTTIVILQS